MEIYLYPTKDAAAIAECRRISLLLKEKPDAVIGLSAGHASLPVLSRLAALSRDKHLSLSRAKFVGVEEWLGADPKSPKSCGQFLCTHFLSRIGAQPDAFCLPDGSAQDMDAESERISTFIEINGGIDHLLLSLGMAGQVLLTESGGPGDGEMRRPLIEPSTQQIGLRYFSQGSRLCGGVTIGQMEFIAARDVCLMALGAERQNIVSRMMELNPPAYTLPASLLRHLPQARLVLDKEAALRAACRIL